METPNAFYCGHCGAPMTDRDVFCKSCQSITPRVQECLDRHLYMSPEKFRGRYGDNKLICPHCESENEYSNGLPLGSPILCCSECHEYFLVPDYVEWSVAKPAQKVKAFFNNWISFVFIYLFFNGVFFFSGDHLQQLHVSSYFFRLFGILRSERRNWMHPGSD